MTRNRDSLLRQAASVESVTDMSAFEDALRERICHWYPADRRYRRSGDGMAQPGDIAYCGHIKDIPQTNGASSSWPECQSCVRLKRIDGHA